MIGKGLISCKKLLTTYPYFFILSLTTIVSLLYFCIGVNSWKFSFVGDEWPFYSFAKEILEKDYHINPFNMNGVHNENPVLGSLYQAVFLQFLGTNNFSWRISNILLIIPLSMIFFLFLRQHFGSQKALISTVILQCSFYLANFFKIGYVNPQSLVLFLLSLYFASRCGSYLTKKKSILLGSALGVSFYIYIGPLFPLFIWPYLLPLLSKKNATIRNVINVFFLITIYFLITLPGLLDTAHWNATAKKTILEKEYEGYSQMLINIFHNFFLFYKNYDYFYNHFVVGPYLDILTRIFTFLGTIITLLNIRKKEYLFLILTYCSTCVVIGATSPYAYTPTTRGIFFLPFGFAFAGIGVYWLIQKFSLKTLSIPILLSIFSVNFYQSQIGVFNETGYSATGLVLKILQEEEKMGDKKETVRLILSDNNNYNYYNLFILQEAYGLHKINFDVFRKSSISCQIINDKRIILFKQDSEITNKLRTLPCPSNHTFSLQVLSPRIGL